MVAALLSALVGFLIVAGLTPIAPTNAVVLTILATNSVFVVALVIVVIIEGREVLRASRARAAAAGLHMRFVGWFAGIAALPALFIALVTSITLERSLDPWFRADLRVLLGNTVEIAHTYEEGQCRTMARELNLMAGDINSAKVMFDQNRALFHDWFATRSLFPRLSRRHDAEERRLDDRDGAACRRTRDRPPTTRGLRGGERYGALLLPAARRRRLRGAGEALGLRQCLPFRGTAGRPARHRVLRATAEEGLRYYQALEAKRVGVQIAFASMYLLVTLILLLSAIRLGLSFANWLVLPIRRLIHATDQVAAGNFYVQVPTRKGRAILRISPRPSTA